MCGKNKNFRKFLDPYLLFKVYIGFKVKLLLKKIYLRMYKICIEIFKAIFFFILLTKLQNVTTPTIFNISRYNWMRFFLFCDFKQ